MDVPKQSLITRDNVPVTVDAVVYFPLSPEDTITKVENYIAATSHLKLLCAVWWDNQS